MIVTSLIVRYITQISSSSGLPSLNHQLILVNISLIEGGNNHQHQFGLQQKLGILQYVNKNSITPVYSKEQILTSFHRSVYFPKPPTWVQGIRTQLPTKTWGNHQIFMMDSNIFTVIPQTKLTRNSPKLTSTRWHHSFNRMAKDRQFLHASVTRNTTFSTRGVRIQLLHCCPYTSKPILVPRKSGIAQFVIRQNTSHQ